MRSPELPSQRRPRSRQFTGKKQKGSGKTLTPSNAEQDMEPLSPAQIRDLRCRVRDSNDPIRYMLVSEFSRRFILYYNVSDDVYVMNDPTGGTLFKRLKTAQTVKKLLGGRTSIVKYTTARGKLKRLSPYRPRI
jgi:hypothetical protein